MRAEERRRERSYHPWWQHRLSTPRRSMLAAVWFCLLGLLWIVLWPARLLADEPAGWVVALVVAATVGWVVLAGAQVAGAIAHHREEASSAR